MIFIKRRTIAFCLLLLFLAATALLCLSYQTVYAVTVNGEPLLYIKSEKEGKMILDHYLDENKKVYGDSVNFKQDVSLERCFRRSDMEFSEVEQGQKKLQKATELEMEAAVIVIDGEDTVAVKDESTAAEVLGEACEEDEAPADNAEILSEGFREEVEIEEKVLDVDAVVAETDAVDTLTGGEEPKLCWEVVYEYTRTLEIEAQIEYVDDDTLAYGTTKEISPGKNGVEEQTIHAVQDQNGNWEESVVSSRVVEPAENQVIARGTGPVFADVSEQIVLGQTEVPISGRITATFGSSGAYWSNRHTGLDIAAAAGTPVRVVSPGTVISAEWSGSYGNMVTVDHGNGISTRYAHLSSISVAVGDTLAFGDVLGLCGSTGNATGDHLHLEVLINGECHNPEEFFNISM